MISFNSYNLTTSYIIVNKVNKSDAPLREVQSEKLSFQDGFSILSDFWRSRTIVLAGTIDASSMGHLGTLLDDLKQNLSGVNKNLDVDYGSGTRRYKATLTRLEAPEDFYNITFLPYHAEFICQPFGYDTASINVSSDDVTSASKVVDMTIEGTYKPLPIITITFDAESGASAVAITSDFTGDTITITQGFNAGDVLIINTETHKVTLNGTQIDFAGPIPEFGLGDGSVTVVVDRTSATYDFDLDYTPRYL